MLIEIDFKSEEALYMQLRNQIILAIANDVLHEGDPLPSVRSLAEDIGINMHTVNKAYALLKQEGFVKLDRRRGAVIAVDYDKMQVMQELADDLEMHLAKAICRGITREELHQLVDSMMDRYERI